MSMLYESTIDREDPEERIYKKRGKWKEAHSGR